MQILDSIKRNKKGIVLILFSSIAVCIGQLFWKLSYIQGDIYILLGFVFYIIGALAMILSYRYGKVSVLQPLLSFNYVLSVIIGFIVLNESLTSTKILGVFLIMLGIFFIAGGDKE